MEMWIGRFYMKTWTKKITCGNGNMWYCLIMVIGAAKSVWNKLCAVLRISLDKILFLCMWDKLREDTSDFLCYHWRVDGRGSMRLCVDTIKVKYPNALAKILNPFMLKRYNFDLPNGFSFFLNFRYDLWCLFCNKVFSGQFDSHLTNLLQIVEDHNPLLLCFQLWAVQQLSSNWSTFWGHLLFQILLYSILWPAIHKLSSLWIFHCLTVCIWFFLHWWASSRCLS